MPHKKIGYIRYIFSSKNISGDCRDARADQQGSINSLEPWSFNKGSEALQGVSDERAPSLTLGWY